MGDKRPNILFLLADQLRAASLPIYGARAVATPNLDRLATEGVTAANAISTCPVCTPYRSMLLTGRHPQSTGHLINFLRTRHDEIGIGDVFSRAGYRTAWVGKWHLHTGTFPGDGSDVVPPGRDRLGFDFWRGYNFHMQYFDGWVDGPDGEPLQWQGYETDALNRYALEFLDGLNGGEPFCLFVSPHQPHWTPHAFAPDEYYARLPESLELPANVAERWKSKAIEAYRHYLAMTLALDDMLGELLAELDRRHLADDTLVIFTSDHGSQFGAHDITPWQKHAPYQESLHVPWIMRWPGVFDGGRTTDELIAPVDVLPTLCGLCGVNIPRTVEGTDLSGALRGTPDAPRNDAVLTMNFTARHNDLADGNEWRGLRTRTHNYFRRLDGSVELYDLAADPLEMTNLTDDPAAAKLREQMEAQMRQRMAALGDEMVPATSCENWFDADRRIICNARGPLGNPESPPDWSLLD